MGEIFLAVLLLSACVRPVLLVLCIISLLLYYYQKFTLLKAILLQVQQELPLMTLIVKQPVLFHQFLLGLVGLIISTISKERWYMKYRHLSQPQLLFRGRSRFWSFR